MMCSSYVVIDQALACGTSALPFATWLRTTGVDTDGAAAKVRSLVVSGFNDRRAYRATMTERPRLRRAELLREMAGAPRNLALRNHLLVRIVKPSGCHCTDGHLTKKVFTEN